MAPKLYMIDASPPVRSVLLTAKALGVTLELERVNVLNKEQLKPEYIREKIYPSWNEKVLGFGSLLAFRSNINITKSNQCDISINPQHTVPTLDDDGKIIWDSHAINVYLVSKYGKDDSLYSKDPYKQAIINQRLHFDSGVLFPSLLQIIRPIIREGAKTISPENAAVVTEAYGFLEKFLEGRQWAAGDSVTLADLNLIPNVTSIAFLVPIDAKQFPNITAWLKRVEALPYYDANRAGLNIFKEFIGGALNA